MKNEIVLLPMTRYEFNMARSGRTVQKRFGNNYCVLISSGGMPTMECDSLIRNGFSVFPLDLSGISWHDLNSKMKSNIVVKYNNGLTVALVSQTIFNLFQKDKA